MRIDVNLASRPFVNRSPQLTVLVALGLAALGCTAWNAHLVLRSRAATRAAAAQREEVKREEEALEIRRASAEDRIAKADLPPLTRAAEAANSVLAQKAISWTLLLERLEEVLPWSAALQQVQTSIAIDGSVSLAIRFRARSHDEALAFIDALESSPCFSDVYPSQDSDPKSPSTDFEMMLDARHDPFCGSPPPGLPKKILAATKKGGRRG
jgi:hypothetical protein